MLPQPLKTQTQLLVCSNPIVMGSVHSTLVVMYFDHQRLQNVTQSVNLFVSRKWDYATCTTGVLHQTEQPL